MFGGVVLHAYAKQEPVLHALSLAVTVFSVMNHSCSSFAVWLLDFVFAHLLCLYAAVGLLMAQDHLLMLVALVVALWLAQKSERVRADEGLCVQVHAALHLTAQLGLHLYLVKINP